MYVGLGGETVLPFAPPAGRSTPWTGACFRAPRHRLFASLDGDPDGREDQGRRDGDRQFQPCKPHHPDHSFGKSGDRHRHGAGRGRTVTNRAACLKSPAGIAAEASRAISAQSAAAAGASPRRTSRSRSRCRPRDRRLSTVPTGQPSRRAASS